MRIQMVSIGLGLCLLSVGAQQPPAKKVEPKASPVATAPAGTTVKKPSAAPVARAHSQAAAISLTTQKQKASYSIGLDIGDNFKKQEMDLDAAALAKGIQDALSGNKRLLTVKETSECLELLRQDLMTKQQGKMRALGEKNRLAGEEFLAA